MQHQTEIENESVREVEDIRAGRRRSMHGESGREADSMERVGGHCATGKGRTKRRGKGRNKGHKGRKIKHETESETHHVLVTQSWPPMRTSPTRPKLLPFSVSSVPPCVRSKRDAGRHNESARLKAT